MQPPPYSLREVTFGNYWIPILQPMLTSENIDENVKFSRVQGKKLQGSFDIMGWMKLFDFGCSMPYNLMTQSFWYLNSKRTFQFSSGPGPKEGYKLAGAQSRGMHGFVPFLADLRFGINALMLDNYITYGVNCERGYMKDPERFMEILDQKMKEFYAFGEPK